MIELPGSLSGITKIQDDSSGNSRIAREPLLSKFTPKAQIRRMNTKSHVTSALLANSEFTDDDDDDNDNDDADDSDVDDEDEDFDVYDDDHIVNTSFNGKRSNGGNDGSGKIETTPERI